MSLLCFELAPCSCACADSCVAGKAKKHHHRSVPKASKEEGLPVYQADYGHAGAAEDEDLAVFLNIISKWWIVDNAHNGITIICHLWQPISILAKI